MLARVTLGVRDIQEALRFYRPVMEALGWDEVFATSAAPGPWAGWALPDEERARVVIATPQPEGAAPGGGEVAFAVENPEAGEALHALALRLGARDAGAAVIRPADAGRDSGVCVTDPDGNRICFLSLGAD